MANCSLAFLYDPMSNAFSIGVFNFCWKELPLAVEDELETEPKSIAFCFPKWRLHCVCVLYHRQNGLKWIRSNICQVNMGYVWILHIETRITFHPIGMHCLKQCLYVQEGQDFNVSMISTCMISIPMKWRLYQFYFDTWKEILLV